MRLRQDEKILQVVTENRCGSNERVRRSFFSSRFGAASLLLPPLPSPHYQMLQYNSEACEAMRKIIMDSKAHGEALSQEFDGNSSKEQIGSRRIISSIALLLSKLQRTGTSHRVLVSQLFLHKLFGAVTLHHKWRKPAIVCD